LDQGEEDEERGMSGHISACTISRSEKGFTLCLLIDTKLQTFTITVNALTALLAQAVLLLGKINDV
jgi:hypothetical protein